MKEQLMELANQLRVPVFAERETIDEAYDYAHTVATASGKANQLAVITAVHVVMNTIVNEIKKIAAGEVK